MPSRPCRRSWTWPAPTDDRQRVWHERVAPAWSRWTAGRGTLPGRAGARLVGDVSGPRSRGRGARRGGRASGAAGGGGPRLCRPDGDAGRCAVEGRDSPRRPAAGALCGSWSVVAQRARGDEPAADSRLNRPSTAARPNRYAATICGHARSWPALGVGLPASPGHRTRSRSRAHRVRRPRHRRHHPGRARLRNRQSAHLLRSARRRCARGPGAVPGRVVLRVEGPCPLLDRRQRRSARRLVRRGAIRIRRAPSRRWPTTWRSTPVAWMRARSGRTWWSRSQAGSTAAGSRPSSPVHSRASPAPPTGKRGTGHRIPDTGSPIPVPV